MRVTEQLCPHCAEHISRCGGRHDPPLPHDWRGKCRDAPAVWVVPVGYPNHGKTTFLSEMTLMLEDLGRAIPGVSADYLGDVATFDTIRGWRAHRQVKRASDATQARRPTPLYLQVRAPSLGTARRSLAVTLVLYDTAGELFADPSRLRDEVPHALVADALWFMVDVESLLSGQDNLKLDDLFQSYRAAMESAGRSRELRDRRAIVVLTKADRIVPRIDKSNQADGDTVNNYLATDPFLPASRDSPPEPVPFDLPAYIRESDRISDVLRRYVMADVPGGRNFVGLCDAAGLELRFCVVSALGHEPDKTTGRFQEKAERYRVLDPFFRTLWSTLAGNSQTPQRRTRWRLILDPTAVGQTWSPDRLESLWRNMSSYADTTTHLLGQTRSIGPVGQWPRSISPFRKLPRLIGPLLDNFGAADMVLAIAESPILDLPEYRTTDWRKRLVVVTSSEQLCRLWPEMVVAHTSDDDRLLIARIADSAAET